jgi:hypothetical protein
MLRDPADDGEAMTREQLNAAIRLAMKHLRCVGRLHGLRPHAFGLLQRNGASVGVSAGERSLSPCGTASVRAGDRP